MTRSAKRFAWTMSAVGMIVVLFGTYAYVVSAGRHPYFFRELADLLLLTALYIICRSLPLSISENTAIDMSFICLIAGVLSKGPHAVVMMIAVSTPFIFETDFRQEKRKPLTILNVSPIKTLFNMANAAISVAVGGAVYTLSGGIPNDLSLPQAMLPLLLFIITVICLNSSILYGLLSLNRQASFLKALSSDFVSLLPSWIASAPIGFFLAYLLQMSSGFYLIILFMFPLLLARYAFKQSLASRKQYYSLIQTLSAAVEAKDRYTNGHSQRVGKYAHRIGQALNLSDTELQILDHAAVLHDLGKIGIKDDILNKPGPLTQEERLVIQMHPRIALDIIGSSSMPEKTREIILHHHEYYNGKGYPDGKKGSELSLPTYILSAADTFDAITSDRPYRKGRPFDDAARIIKEGAGQQFHPEVVHAFLSISEDIHLMMIEEQRIAKNAINTRAGIEAALRPQAEPAMSPLMGNGERNA